MLNMTILISWDVSTALRSAQHDNCDKAEMLRQAQHDSFMGRQQLVLNEKIILVLYGKSWYILSKYIRLIN